MLPISAQGQERPIGTFIAGLNPFRPLDSDYRGFLDLLVGQLAAALANANAYTAERERAEALAQLDQAKTAFFSNISHEFRTPLTLMIGPLEDALAARDTPAAQRELLHVAHRNCLRLLRLVNALLDFSRIEAGRMQATYRPTDLGPLTTEIAESFRPIIEKAGLRYEVICAPLRAPVYLDRDMWEKIVLNLLSNAFKFTLEGSISVRLHESEGAAHLQVSDTGTGIPAAELPRLFERFHRVEGAKGRSFEGSGIGLALVQELVKSHGGGISARSREGVGSDFSVHLPLGTAHLPAERIETAQPSRTSVRADLFVEESMRWLPVADSNPRMGGDPAAPAGAVPEENRREAYRVLLADDNADLRGYIAGLLTERNFEVRAVADGAAALASLQSARPDILISDVMMPKVDGIELLRAVRADPALRDLPVILLSARAGVEAQIEGFDAHADDYLTKPFSAPELLARVRANIAMARVRREAADARRALEVLQNSEARLRAIFETSYQLQGLLSPDGIILHANTTLLEAIESTCDAVIGRHFWEISWFTRTAGMPEFVREAVFSGADGQSMRRELVLNVAGGPRLFDFSMRPVRDHTGAVVSLVTEAVDITEQRRAEESLRQSQKIEALGQLTGGVAHDFNNLLMVISAGLELIDRRLEPAQRARILNGMRQAVQRGSGLSRQLLGFSRRQALRPEPVLLSQRIGSMRELLQRSLRGDIHVLTDFSPDLWTVEVDPGELELVILNLAVNSRDAMPAGGRILISGHNVANMTEGELRGDFVCLAVQDSGTGMTADVIAHAFEPFFTTKEIGKGSGLGLAQTHGFVRASGGFVRIDSTVGSGTTISLYLPRSFKTPADHCGDEVTVSALGAARKGRVLLVEDDDEVAALTMDMLQQLGYETVRVASAEAALGALANGRAIDLVFTDVMMPGAMNGIGLARELRRRRPELPVLLTSGYSDSGWREAGVSNAEMLAKPYRLEELALALTAARRGSPNDMSGT
jgi:PAS domain S-box-containing protein